MDDKPSPQPGSKLPAPAGRAPWNSSSFWLILVPLFVISLFYFNSQYTQHTEITYDFFRKQLDQDNIAEVDFSDGSVITGEFREPIPLEAAKTEEKSSKAEASTSEATKPDTEKSAKTKEDKPNADKHATELSEKTNEFKKFVVTLSPLVGQDLDKELLAKGVKIKAERGTDGAGLLMLMYLFVTLLLFFGVWMMYRRARDQFMGGGILSGFSKSPAKRYEASKNPITFANVAGLEGVKNDLQEVVEFLKNPEKFQRLGGRVPKGVLLMGPPGTGKTLLARAVAGEAGVPFFSISGSEFIQMFVGVGASRVRDMFKTAKDAAPSILFIDEIDAVGRVRGAGLGGGHDEREQTLNQILSEMDGFSQTESVIVLAATNRPDVLDPALLRPGRFDRHVTVDRPTHKGRVEIFKVHVRDVPLADDVDLDRMASGTVGLTGADIRNLVNEAALWAARKGKDKVEMSDFEHARDKVLMGAKREEVLTGKEKRMTAYHESGHALLAWIVPGADRVHKVTIIPRGRALGVTQLLPEEDRMNIGETELHARLVFILGGRAAEKLVFNEYSAGAENDLMQCTRLARRMVTAWGMSERLGPVAYRTSEEHPFLGKEIYEQREFSDFTARLIDEEVARILHAAAQRANDLLAEHRQQLDTLAQQLEEREVLDELDIQKLIGPSSRGNVKSNGQIGDDSPDVPGGVIAPSPPLKPEPQV